MSEVKQEAPVTPEAAPAVIPVDQHMAVEEHRAKLGLKVWLIKTFTITFLIAFALSLGSVIYASVVQGKDFSATFVGEVLTGILSFLQFLLA